MDLNECSEEQSKIHADYVGKTFSSASKNYTVTVTDVSCFSDINDNNIFTIMVTFKNNMNGFTTTEHLEDFNKLYIV